MVIGEQAIDTGKKQDRKLSERSRRIMTWLLLAGIILLGAFLRFYRLGADGYGNQYYASTVKSMLGSWHNFFFAAYEPGGSITVDKPPVGFWVQCISALIFGFNGFALAFPQALAGVLSIPLLFSMVRQQFGRVAGLAAGLVLAAMPISIATERNNTIDGLLVFVLLLASWAVLKSVRSGKWVLLLLGMLLVGVGFNIKMLQAYMVLPAVYLIYLLGARQHAWWKRLLHLGVATLVLLLVSFSWTVAVDLTPVSERPYIGSSENNTVMELIIGHNGISRLFIKDRPAGGNAVGQPGTVQKPGLNNNGQLPPRPPLVGGGQPGNQPQPPNGMGDGNVLNPPAGSIDGAPGGGVPGLNSEVGEAGLLRLFNQQLGDEASWLIPLALLGVPLLLWQSGWRNRLNDRLIGLIFWLSWLIPVMVFLSFTTGIFHTYYLIMVGPAVAGLVGAVIGALMAMMEKRRWLASLLTALLVMATLGYGAVVLFRTPVYAPWIFGTAVGLALIGLLLLLAGAFLRQVRVSKAALIVLLLAMLAAPLGWSLLTTFNPAPESGLPHAGPTDSIGGRTGLVGDTLTAQQQALLNYLEANTEPDTYLMAVQSSHEASPFILATGRPVLTFGGFNGGDRAVSVEQLSGLVASGELRYIVGGQDLLQRSVEIGTWIGENCRVINVPGYSRKNVPVQQPNAPGVSGSLVYDCGNP